MTPVVEPPHSLAVIRKDQRDERAAQQHDDPNAAQEEPSQDVHMGCAH